jgi:hypothetical protein
MYTIKTFEFLISILIFLIFSTSIIFTPLKINTYNVNLDLLIFMLLSFLLFINNLIVINKKIILFLTAYFIYSLFTLFLFNYELGGIIFNYLGLIVYSVIISSLFNYLGYNKMLNIYFKSAIILCFIGVIQEISFLIGVEFLYSYKWILGYDNLSFSGPFLKINSLFVEPGFFGPFIVPASIASFLNFNNEKQVKHKFFYIIILLALFFTFSLIAYLGFFLFLIYHFRKRKTLLLISFLFAFIIFLIIPSINSRLLGFTQTSDLNEVNFSSLVYIVNFDAFIHSLNYKFILGNGIDSYGEIINSSLLNNNTFFNYESILKLIDNPGDLQLNGSPNLFLRLLVEFGFIGFILIFSFFNRMRFYFITHIWIIFLFGIIAISFRSGMYLRFDLWLFIGFIIYNNNNKLEFKSFFKSKF